MCCSFSVDSALGKDAIYALLELSAFKQISESKWVRQFPARDDQERWVACYYYGLKPAGELETIHFNLVPSIGGHSEREHRNAAIEAAVVLQIMQVIHEQSMGTMRQHSLIGACGLDNEGSDRQESHFGRVLVRAGAPVQQHDLCLGFRTVLHDGIALVMSDV